MIVATGNDIIDLGDSDAKLSTFHRSFVSRVCDSSEIDCLARSQRPDQQFWYLWCAKETAFKALQRINPQQTIVPSRLVVDPRQKVVTFENWTVAVVWIHDSDCLVCYGYLVSGEDPPRLLHAYSPLGSLVTRSDEAHTLASHGVRKLAKQVIAQHFELEQQQLEIVRPKDERYVAGYGPPEVWYEGRPIPELTLSLAHHGRYVGCAVARGTSA